MRNTLFTVFGLSLLTAFPAAARQNVSECEAVWKSVTDLMTDMTISKPGRMSVTDKGCLLRDLLIQSSDDYGASFKVRSIAFGGTGLERIAEGLPPTALSLDVQGLQISGKAGDPAFTYLMMAQNARSTTDLVIRAHWDEASKAVFLDQFDADFWGDNSVKWSATVTGLDLSSADAIMLSAGGAALTKLDAEVISNGLFEAYLLMPLGNMVLYDMDGPENAQQDPEVVVGEYRTAAIEGLKGVPETLLPVASREALQTLLTEMPNPSGTLVFSMKADPGIGAGTLSRAAISGAPKTVAEAAGYLDGAVFDITYTPTPPE